MSSRQRRGARSPRTLRCPSFTKPPVDRGWKNLSGGLSQRYGESICKQLAGDTPTDLIALRKRYVYIKQTNTFWCRQTRLHFAAEAIRNMHWHEMPIDDQGQPMNPLNLLIQDQHGCDKVEALTFYPGQEEIVWEQGGKRLNTWSPPDIEPIPGDVLPFLRHIEYLTDGNAEAAIFLLDYLAHLVQFPDVKQLKTPLIIGAPGIGKSLIAQFMTPILGSGNVTAIENSELVSQFNDWADGTSLCVIHELMTMDRLDTMNRLKSYITESLIRINQKGLRTYNYTNRMNFLMFSNHDDAAKIEKGDRRYFVWRSQAEARGRDYYEDLFDWFQHGGAEALFHYMKTRTLDHYDPFAPAPVTAAKLQIIEDSRPPTDALLQELFNEGAAPFRHDLVVLNHVIDWLQHNRKLSVSVKKLSSFLNNVGGIVLGQYRLLDRSRPTIWVIRNHDRWAAVSKDERTIARGYQRPDEASLA
jgi:hypothetical protein